MLKTYTVRYFSLVGLILRVSATYLLWKGRKTVSHEVKWYRGIFVITLKSFTSPITSNRIGLILQDHL